MYIVCGRGHLMQALPPGAMLAVAWSKADLTAFLKTQVYGTLLSVATENAPQSIVLAGPVEAIEQMQTDLTQREIKTRRLNTSQAFYSAMMDPCLNAFASLLKTVTLRPPQQPFISNVTGTWIQPEQATDPNYWVTHLRQTVQFSRGVTTLLQEAPHHIFLEVGAGLTLNSLVRKHLTTSSHELVLSTLPPPQSDEPDQSVLLTTLGHLWLTGLELNWTAFYQHETRRRIPLPGYPFARQIHWVKPVPKSPVSTKPVSLPPEEEIAALVPPPKQDNLADWFYVPQWQPALPLLPVTPSGPTSWLLFMDDCGIGSQLAARLNHHNQIIQATPGEHFHALTNQTYTLNPQRREDYEALFNHLSIRPTQIVYLWGVTKTGDPIPSAYEYYNQLLFLVQALDKQSTVEHPVRLTILTNQMQPVQPQEELDPAKAVLLGLVKTIPLEYPHISCRTVDVLVPPAESFTAFIEQLVLELTTSSKDPLVAYRQQKRWVQKYQPTPLPSGSTTPRLKEQGIYLIIGGLGGVGLALAEYLAHHYQAKLALVGRTPFPPKSTWNSWLHEGLSSPLDSWAPTLAEEENHLWQISPIKGIPDYPGLAEQLVALCCSYAYHYLTTPLTQPTTVTKAHLKTLLRVQPKLEKFFEFMLRCLVDHHYAVVLDETVTLLQTPLPPANLATTLQSEFPGFRGLFTLLNHCAAHYPQALAGEIPSISVLYPEGKFDFLNACDQDTVAHSYEPIYRQLLRYLLSQLLLSHSLAGRPLKILEIGAGNGLLTWELLPAVVGKNVEYYFTDLGPSFVKQAQRQAETAAITFMQFKTLDISKNPLEQGVEPESFDIILGMNVVHATPHLEETLFHLQLLLAPNGLLGLIETIQSYVWVDMAWGLTEGWWYFQDYPLRTQSPLLSLAQWETLLQRQPFRYVKTFPDDTTEKRAKTDIGLILAQKRSRSPQLLHQPAWLSEMTPLQRTRAQIAKLQQLEQSEEAAVEVYYADVADPTSMTKVLTSVKERFGLLNGVIHAALVLKDGMIQFKEPEIAKQVLAAKVTGTEILYELVKDQPLDFFVLCSSLASVIGTYAQSDYCAANAYQDAFAHQKRVQDHFPIWSINWGIWQDTGAAMRLMMSKTAAASHPQWVAHPLFDYRIVSGSRIVYAGHLNIEKDWLLKEHRLNHQAIVPGTAYLELARAAFQHHTGTPTFELQSVYFLKPLVVPAGQEVEFLTLLEPVTDGEEFQFTILSGPLTEHAKGTILPGAQATSQQYDIALLKRYCPQPQPIISANQSADQLTTVGPVAVGPRWSQALQTVQFGIQQGLALISLPTTYLDDLLHYHLHPALLDIATSFALGNGDFYLPLAYQKLRYYQPLPAKFYAYARYLEDSTSGQETLSYEVLLLDETGQECVAIEGFTLRKVATEHLVLETLPETGLTLNNLLAPNIHPELQEGMSSAEGAEAFTRVLAQDAPQVVVSTQELTAVLTRNETQHILRNKTEHLQQFQAVEQQIQRHQAQSPSPLKLAPAITFEVSTALVQDWEQALIPIWQEVLGVQQITVTDNFFELNGDSLLAIMVTTRICTAFQIEATPDLLFKAPTIALLAQVLAHQNQGTSGNQTIFSPMTSNLVG